MQQPMQVYQGRHPNPNVLYGQQDIETMPVTAALNSTNWGRTQLSNGWDRTSFGLRQFVAGGYLQGQIPFSPGLTRMQGRNTTDFMPQGTAPSQWQYHVQGGPGLQPDYPGGPGQIMGNLMNPGSGA